jgi:hypothetical protein
MAAQMAEYACHAVLRHFREFGRYESEMAQGQWRLYPPRRHADFPVGVMGLGALANPPINMQNPGLNVNSRCSPVMTPTQATKAGLPDAIVKHYATSFPGAMKLAPENLTEARRAFGDINT